MGKRLYIFTISMLVFLAGGCTDQDNQQNLFSNSSSHPTANEILTENPEADIFQFDGLVYQTGIDWVEEETFTKDVQVGTITQRNEQGTNFIDGMSSKLPVGSVIYSVKEGGGFLLVEVNGQSFKYSALVEG